MENKFRRKEDKVIPDQYRIEVIKTGYNYKTREQSMRESFLGFRDNELKTEQTITSITGDNALIIKNLIDMVKKVEEEKEKLQQTVLNYKEASEKLQEYFKENK